MQTRWNLGGVGFGYEFWIIGAHVSLITVKGWGLGDCELFIVDVWILIRSRLQIYIIIWFSVSTLSKDSNFVTRESSFLSFKISVAPLLIGRRQKTQDLKVNK